VFVNWYVIYTKAQAIPSRIGGAFYTLPPQARYGINGR
jgi:hypothetical protein